MTSSLQWAGEVLSRGVFVRSLLTWQNSQRRQHDKLLQQLGHRLFQIRSRNHVRSKRMVSFHTSLSKTATPRAPPHPVYLRLPHRPVVVLWYSALLLFILTTVNGKWARGYITHKLCPGLRTNERAVDGIIRREIAMGRRQFFVRRLLGDEELGSMGWIQRAAMEDMHAEYVFRTKKFSVTEERARRERKSSVESNIESMPLDGVDATSTTPTKRTESNPNTPDTVSTNSSDDTTNFAEDDGEENETSTPDANVQQCEDEFECLICLSPVEDGDRVGVTVCGHIFHQECLKQWIARKNQCPLCKKRIASIATSPRPTRSGTEEEGTAPDNISGEMAAAQPRRLNRILFPNARPSTTPSRPPESNLSLSEPNSRSRRRRTGLIIYE